jgi:carbon storage regulator
MLGDDIVLHVMEIVGNSVRVGIQAPRSLPVYREEIWEASRRRTAPRAGLPGQPARAGAGRVAAPAETLHRGPRKGVSLFPRTFEGYGPSVDPFRTRRSTQTMASRMKVLLLGGIAVAAGTVAYLKRDRVAGLLPSRTEEPAAPPPPPAPSNYDAPARRPTRRPRCRRPSPRCTRPASTSRPRSTPPRPRPPTSAARRPSTRAPTGEPGHRGVAPRGRGGWRRVRGPGAGGGRADRDATCAARAPPAPSSRSRRPSSSSTTRSRARRRADRPARSPPSRPRPPRRRPSRLRPSPTSRRCPTSARRRPRRAQPAAQQGDQPTPPEETRARRRRRLEDLVGPQPSDPCSAERRAAAATAGGEL